MNFEKDDSKYFIRSMNLSIYLDDYKFPKHNNNTGGKISKCQYKVLRYLQK